MGVQIPTKSVVISHQLLRHSFTYCTGCEDNRGETTLEEQGADGLNSNPCKGALIIWLAFPTSNVSWSMFLTQGGKWGGTPPRTVLIERQIFYSFLPLLKIVIHVPSPIEASGWAVDYEDMESGDNGFPGDTDETDVVISSRTEIVRVCNNYPQSGCIKKIWNRDETHYDLDSQCVEWIVHRQLWAETQTSPDAYAVYAFMYPHPPKNTREAQEPEEASLFAFFSKQL